MSNEFLWNQTKQTKRWTALETTNQQQNNPCWEVAFIFLQLQLIIWDSKKMPTETTINGNSSELQISGMIHKDDLKHVHSRKDMMNRAGNN